MGEVNKCFTHLSLDFPQRRGGEGGFFVDYFDILVVSIDLILFQYYKFRDVVISTAKKTPHVIACLSFLAFGVVQSYAEARP